MWSENYSRCDLWSSSSLWRLILCHEYWKMYNSHKWTFLCAMLEWLLNIFWYLYMYIEKCTNTFSLPLLCKRPFPHRFCVKSTCSPPCVILIFRFIHKQQKIAKRLWNLGQEVNQWYSKQPVMIIVIILGYMSGNALNGFTKVPKRSIIISL